MGIRDDQLTCIFVDDRGKTALDYAKEHKQFAMVTYLIMRSAVNSIADKLESYGV